MRSQAEEARSQPLSLPLFRDGLRPSCGWDTRWVGWGHHPHHHHHQQGHRESLRHFWLHPNYQSPVWPRGSCVMAGQCIAVAPSSPHHTPLPGRCSLIFLYIYCLFIFILTSCIAEKRKKKKKKKKKVYKKADACPDSMIHTSGHTRGTTYTLKIIQRSEPSERDTYRGNSIENRGCLFVYMFGRHFVLWPSRFCVSYAVDPVPNCTKQNPLV